MDSKEKENNRLNGIKDLPKSLPKRLNLRNQPRSSILFIPHTKFKMNRSRLQTPSLNDSASMDRRPNQAVSNFFSGSPSIIEKPQETSTNPPTPLKSSIMSRFFKKRTLETENSLALKRHRSDKSFKTKLKLFPSNKKVQILNLTNVQAKDYAK